MEATTEVVEVIESAPVPQPLPAELTSEAPQQDANTKKAKGFDTLDAVLKAITDQDEQIKAMRTQLQDMLATNVALKRGIKQIVTDAEKNGDLELELTSARKKLAMLKTFINGGAS